MAMIVCEEEFTAEDAALLEATEAMFMKQQGTANTMPNLQQGQSPANSSGGGAPNPDGRSFGGADRNCNPQPGSAARFQPYARPPGGGSSPGSSHGGQQNPSMMQQQQNQHPQQQHQPQQPQQQQQQQQQQPPQRQMQQQQQQQQQPAGKTSVTHNNSGDHAGSSRSFQQQQQQQPQAQPAMAAIPVSSPGKNQQRTATYHNQNPTSGGMPLQAAGAGGSLGSGMMNGGGGGGGRASMIPAPQNQSNMPVLPPMEEVKEYQKFVLQVLEKSDVEFMGGKRIVKRSGWRKLALTFGVSFELLTEEITRDDNYNVIYAKFTQRAILPNGRFADGWGACDHREKKFAKPNHDIAATAETRAKNRACADLFGIGDAKR